ncbi:bifunctional 4-hydroxy-3-methylbut-2-enyl diphosphate reductase/30S ribosomal protein S1 [Thermotalea metallivorans]|uniref:4-hydroxy-3-methylbut-2-enyl diphosphate reductase n=1 Tax=Thermotalea metallivorans TaxID=520762 RepID=A0A140L8I1_9FIRM|nr:bifunctional 4-hydroxy-3-methylbut-2-enyl diphosphate reductase/30S ribosomal protein S1 [Thermotalea metallivorans]KXG76856.1 30S ribosomal protein S1 [Thermotalea metallivorans]
MEIIIAKKAGFCFGVKEAMNKAFAAANQIKDRPIYTYGPLIHNSQTIDKLESMGIRSIEDIEKHPNSTIIVRSHGVPLSFYDLADRYGIEIIDATCPFVRKVQKIAREYYLKGYAIVIVGDPNHPEVIGIHGWCENKASIVQREEDIDQLPHHDKVCVVAQTTITQELWDAITKKLEEKAKILEKFNTICIATKDRQTSCAELAKAVDAMIVIGGHHSSNTQKLVQISKKYCKNTFAIETVEELPMEEIKNLNKIGITAGASTPDWIIKEVIDKMSNTDQHNNEMMHMMEEIENSLKVPRRGQTVKGKVIHVTDNEIMVNIGYKSDGIIPKEEISNDPSVNPQDIVKEGDEIEVYVLKTDDGEGNLLLSKKRIDAVKGLENLEQAYRDGQILTVRVVEVVKGGVIAVYKEIRGFIPASQLSDSYVEDMQTFIGKTLDVKIIDFNKSKKKVVFSRRVVIQEENERKRKLLWQNIDKGSVIEGEVKRITNFGVFVDIGGIDGLIHISDLSWGRVNHPKEVVQIGDKVKVKVIDLDQDKNKVSLSLKLMTPEPWTTVEEKYHVGDIVSGKVVRLADFGAFVELEPGLDGLVHISQISDKHIAKPSQEVHVGQNVLVKILEVNREAKRISLSIKEANAETLNEQVVLPQNDEPVTIGEILEERTLPLED